MLASSQFLQTNINAHCNQHTPSLILQIFKKQLVLQQRNVSCVATSLVPTTINRPTLIKYSTINDCHFITDLITQYGEHCKLK